MAALTTRRLVDLLTERTGYPRPMVQHMVDAMAEVVATGLRNGADIRFARLFRIRVETRVVAPRLRGQAMPKVRKAVLSIKPAKAFRKEMDSWTSLASSLPTNTPK